ncbi:hypothetical protein ASF41_22090 [Methylobacterium sp. Leaf111]|uniref:calcium-binding protein n=1 Tax=Methylobacterium sp. Leaf111 TaxID=1736257 RepID=UPI0006F83E39|nr:calcium-binding protein [Methylobacterium sp. Leaf111]KQP64051.1 hypothetical protein ASF41_22090 [Methylobacterium sp. Leaf111]
MAIRQGTPQDDILIGTVGSDTFIGGGGNDISTGGDGGDRFVYQSLNDLSLWTGSVTSPHETITDFGESGQIIEGEENDVLDFSAIPDLLFIGDDGFSASGRAEFRFTELGQNGLLLLFDRQGDGAADDFMTLDQYIGATSIGEGYRPPVETNIIISSDLYGYHYDVGGSTNDVLYGEVFESGGGNRLYGFEGDDRLYSGNTSTEELFGGAGNDTFYNRAVSAYMEGGTGNDTFYVKSEFDQVVEKAGEGIDRVISSASYFRLADNVENVSLIGDAYQVFANGLDNTVNGSDAQNSIFGGGGKDTLSGAGGVDVIRGEGGNDWIRGGIGADYLVGGDGADKFAYYTVTESTRTEYDTIVDFRGLASGASASERDRIDLHRIDADTTTIGDEAFRFIGSGAFTGKAGELHIVAATIDVVDPSPVYGDEPYQTPGYIVEGDVTGDGTADFRVAVATDYSLRAGDFFL